MWSQFLVTLLELTAGLFRFLYEASLEMDLSFQVIHTTKNYLNDIRMFNKHGMLLGGSLTILHVALFLVFVRVHNDSLPS